MSELTRKNNEWSARISRSEALEFDGTRTSRVHHADNNKGWGRYGATAHRIRNIDAIACGFKPFTNQGPNGRIFFYHQNSRHSPVRVKRPMRHVSH